MNENKKYRYPGRRSLVHRVARQIIPGGTRQTVPVLVGR